MFHHSDQLFVDNPLCQFIRFNLSQPNVSNLWRELKTVFNFSRKCQRTDNHYYGRYRSTNLWEGLDDTKRRTRWIAFPFGWYVQLHHELFPVLGVFLFYGAYHWILFPINMSCYPVPWVNSQFIPHKIWKLTTYLPNHHSPCLEMILRNNGLVILQADTSQIIIILKSFSKGPSSWYAFMAVSVQRNINMI